MGWAPSTGHANYGSGIPRLLPRRNPAKNVDSRSYTRLVILRLLASHSERLAFICMTATYAKPPRRLLYVVNEDWAFLLNRLPMARAAQKAGFEVHVATRVNNGAAAIEAEGFTLHPIPLRRGGISPLSAIPAILALRQITGRIKPDIAHHSGLQCCVYGSIAAFGRKFPYVSAHDRNGLRLYLGDVADSFAEDDPEMAVAVAAGSARRRRAGPEPGRSRGTCRSRHQARSESF